MRTVLLAGAVALGCTPHGEDSTPTPAPPAESPPPEAASAPPPREIQQSPLERALQAFPEDRQELTLNLGARVHRCCYWGADTSPIITPDGSPPVRWVGPDVPSFVAESRAGMTLFTLDPHAGGWLAFYRERYGEGGCETADKRSRCEFGAAMFDADGHELWFAKLDPMFRNRNAQIDDVHWTGGLLVFNESCWMTDSKRCGALIAYDPVQGAVRWRSPARVSNDAFRITGDRIVSVYSTYDGFVGTGVVTVLDRASGHVLARRKLDWGVDDVLVHDDVIEFDVGSESTWLEMTPGTKGLDLVEVPRPKWFAPKAVSLYE